MAMTRGALVLALGATVVSCTVLGDGIRAAPAGIAQEGAAAAATPAPMTDAEIEQFLRTAKIVRAREAGKGVTNSIRATLSNGTFTHDAHIQTIDEYKREFRGHMTLELDFRDSWKFNVAAYKLDRLLGLHMVPVSVEGRHRSDFAAITWWVDDIAMDEGTRSKQKIQAPPDKVRFWSEQLSLMRMFDQLIHNTDRNMGNMLIGHDWRLWLIDHTRAFRKHTTLRSPNQVTRCDRAVLERLKALDAATLKEALGKYLDGGQIRSLLARRDLIVKGLEARGSGAVFDRQQPEVTGPVPQSVPPLARPEDFQLSLNGRTRTACSTGQDPASFAMPCRPAR